MTLLAEVSKLAISLILYVRLPKSAHTHRLLAPRHLLPFAAPAAIYFVNNNLLFVILAYVNSTTYQILSSLKTVFTGLLFRLLLHRRLSDLQSVAIVLLACGTATSQLGASASCPASAERESSVVGVGAAVLTCMLSALGGVYSEHLVKHEAKAHSIHLQNALLYIWGLAFNSLALIGRDGVAIWTHGLLRGYTPVVWALVANNALNGLAISAILKHAPRPSLPLYGNSHCGKGQWPCNTHPLMHARAMRHSAARAVQARAQRLPPAIAGTRTISSASLRTRSPCY